MGVSEGGPGFDLRGSQGRRGKVFVLSPSPPSSVVWNQATGAGGGGKRGARRRAGGRLRCAGGVSSRSFRGQLVISVDGTLLALIVDGPFDPRIFCPPGEGEKRGGHVRVLGARNRRQRSNLGPCFFCGKRGGRARGHIGCSKGGGGTLAEGSSGGDGPPGPGGNGKATRRGRAELRRPNFWGGDGLRLGLRQKRKSLGFGGASGGPPGPAGGRGARAQAFHLVVQFSTPFWGVGATGFFG